MGLASFNRMRREQEAKVEETPSLEEADNESIEEADNEIVEEPIVDEVVKEPKKKEK